MENVFVRVKVPAISRECEFQVPDDMAVKDVKKLMVRILNSEYGVPGNDTEIMLTDMSDGKTLRPEFSFEQSGITNGARLILM